MTSRSLLRVVRFSSAVLLSAAAACAGPESMGSEEGPSLDIEDQEQALTDGTATTRRPEVGQVTINGTRCTATLIHQRWFITAAHCVNYGNPTGGTLTVGSAAYAIRQTFSLGSALGEGDVAVGRLTSAVPSSIATPATIADGNVQSGQTVTVIGYGCSARPQNGTFAKRFTTFNWGSSNRLCRGDSGGPVRLGNLDDGGAIVAVNSGYTYTDTNRNGVFDPGEPSSDLFGLVPQFKGQIERLIGGDEYQVGAFRPWTGYGISSGRWLTGDLNGDRQTDLIHLVDSDYVHTWISNGRAGFTVGSFRAWPGYHIGSGEWVNADLNGDGRDDLVHLVNSDYVHTWMSNGDGTFAIGSFRPWAGYGISSGRWVTGDLNGDRRVDLVHLVNSDYVHTWMSSGDGNFTVGGFQPWPGYAIGSGSWVTGDLNGDRRMDLVHLVNSDYVHTWLSNGNGNFSVGTFRPWPGYGISSGRWVTGDFNADGRTDLVHLVNSDYVHSWMSNGNGSFALGAFSPWAGYAIGSGRWVTGDFDADGRTDLVHLTDSDYIHTWKSRGDGTFGVSASNAWPWYGVSAGLWFSGQFGGDARSDLIHLVTGADYGHPWISVTP